MGNRDELDCCYNTFSSKNNGRNYTMDDFPSMLQLNASYIGWKSPVSSTKLADNGFIYTGVSDTVQCVSCKVKLSNLSETDNIQQRHYSQSPLCKSVQNLRDNKLFVSPDFSLALPTNRNFCLGDNTLNGQLKMTLSAENYPIRTTNNAGHEQSDSGGSDLPSLTLLRQTDIPAAKMKQYETEPARLKSFIKWPISSPMEPVVLARAGLFYTEILDKVKCAFCLGSMYNWEVDDNPLAEHKRYFPDCPFVKYKIYNELSAVNTGFINSESNHRNSNLSNRSSDMVIDSDPATLVSTAGPRPDIQRTVDCQYTSLATKPKLRQLNAVKIVNQMGYSINMIKLAVKRIPNFDPEKLKSDVLLDAIFEIENEGYNSNDCFNDTNDDYDEDLTAHVEVKKQIPEASSGTVTLKPTMPTVPIFLNASSQFQTTNQSPELVARAASGYSSGTFNVLGGVSNYLKTTTGIFTVQQPTSNNHQYPKSEVKHKNIIYKTHSSDSQDTVTNIPVKKPSLDDPKLKTLSEEHQKLLKNKICNVCKKQNVCILFLPCRHLLCCEPCAEESRKCPQCNQVIVGTVKIFLG